MSINITIEGAVTSIGQLDNKNEKYPKRDIVVLVDDPKYPDYIKVQLTGDKAKSPGILAGAYVKLSCNIKGRNYNDKDGNERNFTVIEAWKMEVTSQPSATDYSNVKKAEPIGQVGFTDVPF